MILHAMAATTKIERLKKSIFFVKYVALQGGISFRKRLVKNDFRETSDAYFINFMFIEEALISVKN